MKRLILSIITIILSLTIYAQSEEILRHIKYAETAYKLENYKDAIDEYETVIKLDPNYADAYYNSAVICEKMQTDYYFKKAIEHYKKYIQLVPKEKNAINDKIFELEYLLKKEIESKKQLANVLGTWKTTSYNSRTGQPDYIVEIVEFQGKLRVKLLPNSRMFSNTLTNIVATTELYKNSLLFTYTDNKNWVPNPAKWDALRVVGGVVGSVAGGNVGNVISKTTDAAGTVGGAVESAASPTIAQKFHDFFITEFGTDTLKGLVQQYSSVQDGKTNNIKIEYDNVIPVEFVRGSDYYSKYEEPPKPKEPKRVYLTLAPSLVFAFLEHPKSFPMGGAINLNWSLITKRSFNKKHQHGFSMGLEFLLKESAANKGLEYYGPDVSGTDHLYYFDGAIAWNIRYTVGWTGISQISDKLSINWGLKPVGLHVSGYGKELYTYDNSNYNNYNYMYGGGICGYFDLGLGIRVSKKCIISPYIRFAYALDFLEEFYHLYRKYINVSVFPITIQPGVSFSFIRDKATTKN